MEARLIAVRDISPDDEDAWRRLASRAVEPNPFAEPEFFHTAAMHLPGYADAQLVVAQEGEDWLGIIPIAGTARPLVPPRAVFTTIAQPTMVSGLQTPLIDRDALSSAADALTAGLKQASRDAHVPGIVLFDWIWSDGPVASSMQEAWRSHRCPVFVKKSWTRGILTREGLWAAPAEGKKRRELARRQRVFAREAGGEVVLVDRTHDPDACDQFLRMESSGWKAGEGGLAITRDRDNETWFRECHRRLVAADRAILHSLDVGSVPVAMHYWVRAGEGIFVFRIAFDEKYARFSPGTLLLFASLASLYEGTDATFVDSATNDNNQFFLNAMRERRELTRLYLATGGALDKAAVRSLPLLRHLAAIRRRAKAKLARPGSFEVSQTPPGNQPVEYAGHDAPSGDA